jgi:serine-type D-Ala-D-Ala carboxypeptidase (penicillin-binding protein 5/6)
VSSIGRRRVVATVVVTAIVAGSATLTSLAAPGGTAPPPTPVPPKGSLSPFPTALATPSNAIRPPALSARSALLADLTTGTLMDAKDPDLPVPIASLTKVMTALITLDRTDPADVITVDPRAVFDRGDYGASSTLGLRAGERITVENLLYAMLLGSANDAAVALAVDIAGSEDAFVRLMNARAARLGMRHTEFRSVNGLDDRGLSTARDLLVLVRAVDPIEGFARITSTRVRTIPSPSGPARRIQNRNALLWLYPGAFGTKTGSTALAGSCLIASATRDGRRLVAIVLHAQDEAFSDGAALLNYGFEGFTQQTFAAAGADEGTLRIRGGEVPVVAGAALEALVPTLLLGRVRRAIVAAPHAAFPPPPGARVGSLTVSIPGLTIGSVPLVVSAVPPPTSSGGPWWARAAGSVGRAVSDAVHAIAS